MPRAPDEPVLDVRRLSVRFALPKPTLFARRSHLRAVRDVSFALQPGRTLGLVGESGSGKTTTAMAAIRLLAAAEGEVLFRGRDLLKLDAEAMRAERRNVQVIFQDPYSSLNPRDRVRTIVREPLDLMRGGESMAAREARVAELVREVGLRHDQLDLFPHQFSGGQRQRIAIARALATNPQVVVCDEPVSALDVAIQAQILNLLRRLQDERGLSYLFISHDLGVVQHICDDVAVMYLGQIVEQADRASLFGQPRHPYTATLLAAAPSLARRKSARTARQHVPRGDPPSPFRLPAGCTFAARCPRAEARCREAAPALRDVGGTRVACHFPLGG
ncbi:ATP-binding cassette domain-containing protein [Aquibium sp. A9E412]|uniref:ABC transporter ATP-binding protein n=1 Tax=Aquibium sp. A9E412 TaxID=2976767 RepID=UPI0025B1B728|nr:oligopeptide/dipeptide ABC transporter ATP-binding protein [Aquibium sp. A9E412]MDN2568078.1 ATP-binding cassette domain-containing protein [Aquibium sp. A9E412]